MAKQQDKKPAAGRRKTKDHVFTDLFDQKEYQKLLYKTLHPEAPKIKSSELETLTLETILDRGIYNDLGILAKDKILLLVEAQSTYSENILYRSLMYLAKSYQKYADDRKIRLYGTKKAQMPAPELYMVYSGEKDKHPDILSFKQTFFKDVKCDIEVKIKVIYADGSGSIIDQYITFCRVLDEQRKLYPDNPRKAIQETVRICKNKSVLKKYLEKHETEVVDMMESLYSQEKVDELREYEAEQRGEARGIGIGEARGIGIGEARGEARGIGIGEARGEKKGKAESFWSLVQDKIITKVTAAKKMGITVAEFDKLCEEYAFGK